MGTRSLTHVHDEDDKCFFTFYKQHDGYPEGWGKELAEFLDGFRVVNGLSGDEGKIANGMSCLAAQIIAEFKEEAGQFYIYKAGAKGCGEEFVYRVKLGPAAMSKGKFPRPQNLVRLICEDSGGTLLFEGDPTAYATFLKDQETAAE